MPSQSAAVSVVRSIRQALTRVDGDSVTLTRAEFESIAAVVDPAPKASAPRAVKAQSAQQPLPLGPVESIKLPAGLQADQLTALLETPKTVTTLAREAKVSKGSIKRALALMPGVEVIRTKTRAHRAGRRPFVYALH